MRLMKFATENGSPVVVNMDNLLIAVTNRETTHAKERTKLVFSDYVHTVIDMPLAAFLDLMTR
jgi:hypothetical protein